MFFMDPANRKRPLRLETLDEVIAEATSLLESGYVAKGQWNLGQSCFHLAEWTRFPMDGFPTPPLFLKAIFNALNAVGVTERMKQGILANGFKAGTPTAPQTAIDPANITDDEGVQQFIQVVQRAKRFDWPLQPSPIFGEMDRDLYVKVSRLHAEHHLAFLWPKSNPSSTVES